MKKIKLGVMVLLALLCFSAAGCLFSFIYGSYKDLSRQKRLEIFLNFKSQEKEFQILENEYWAWKKLPDALQKFHKENILSMDEFAAFRRDLDSRLAANQLQPPRMDFAFGKSLGNIKKVAVRFSLEGNYRNLKKFIFDMELKSKMYFFESLVLSAGGTTVKGVFTLEVYLGE
jgi:hypothetical protein